MIAVRLRYSDCPLPQSYAWLPSNVADHQHLPVNPRILQTIQSGHLSKHQHSNVALIIVSLCDKLTPDCIALVYYSGHGAEVGVENYLIPFNNAGLEKASDLPDEAMPLARILDALGKSDGQLNLIILDACRDNPFPGAPTSPILAIKHSPSTMAS